MTVTGLAAPGVRVLLVGSGTYQAGSRLLDVPAMSSTVRDLGDELVRRCDLSPSNLHVLLDPADPGVFGDTIIQQATRADDVFLFYYVGHGLVDGDGTLFLATRKTMDLDAAIPGTQAVAFSDVRAAIRAHCRARTIVMILDCCDSGRAVGAVRGALDNTVGQILVTGSYLLAATANDERALAVPGDRHTAFTGALLRLLRQGDPAAPPSITLDHAYRYLVRELSKQGLPAPHRHAGDRGGDLVLAANLAYHPPRTRPPGDASTAIVDRCPYRGLEAFGADDAEYFFGRERLVGVLRDRLVAQLDEPGMLVVVGPSGAGKSSVLRAGLVPALAGQGLGAPGSRRWPRGVFTPDIDPMGRLAAPLAVITGAEAGTVRDALTADPGRITALIRHRTPESRVVLVVDQFEEVFTHCQDESQRTAFIGALCALTRREGTAPPAVRVVLAIRADFYSRCIDYPALAKALQDNQVVIGPMTQGELRDVIEKPAQAVGMAFEPGLVELLLHDMGARHGRHEDPTRDAGALPLLSHVLLATWQQHDGALLTVDGYHATGGIDRAVSTTADEVFHGLAEGARDVARRMLLNLVTIGDEGGDTRRRVDRQALVNDSGPPEVSERVLRAFTDARLVTVDHDVGRGRDTAEITHEALLHAWPRLGAWLAEDRAWLRAHHRLADDVHAWDENGQASSRLYRNPELDAICVWLIDPRRRGDLTELEHDFVGRSVEAEFQAKEAARRRSLRLRRLTVGLAIALVAVIGISVLAVNQWLVSVGRQLVSEANASRDTDPEGALLLGLEALELDDSPEARKSVLATLTQTRYAGTLPGGTPPHYAVAFSPDGRTLATGGAKNKVTLWDVGHRSRRTWLAELAGPGGVITAIAFSPDRRTLVAVNDGRTGVLWDVGDRGHPVRLADLPNGSSERYLGFEDTTSVAFGAGGDVVATNVWEGKTVLWDIRNRRAPKPLATLRAQGHVVGVAVSSDSRTATTVDDAGFVSVWDIANLKHPVLLATVRGHTERVTALALRPDDRVLATVGADMTAILWDISDRAHPRQIAPLVGHIGRVTSVAFCPDGAVLATGSEDRTTILWDVRDPEHPSQAAKLTGATGTVLGVAFSPSGKTVASSGGLGTVLWDVPDPAQPARQATTGTHTNIIKAVAFSADEHLMLTGTDGATVGYPIPYFGSSDSLKADDRAILWDITDRAHPRELGSITGFSYGVLAAAFSADGNTVAIASIVTSGAQTTLWDIHDPLHPKRLGPLPTRELIDIVVITPDGRTLITGHGDQRATLWDITNPTKPTKLAAVDDPAGSSGMSLSPDGKTLAVGDDEKGVLWDVSDRRVPHRLGEFYYAGALRFSPNGRILASGVRLLNIEDPADPILLGTLSGHIGDAAVIGFSADGRTAVTDGIFDNPTFWDVSDPAQPSRVATQTGEIGYEAYLSPSGSTLVTVDDQRATLWDNGNLVDIIANPVGKACEVVRPETVNGYSDPYLPSFLSRAVCVPHL